jgi:hypothetical protein
VLILTAPQASALGLRAVQALPVGYLEPLQEGEALESAEACLRRLLGYALRAFGHRGLY